ncbi:hypothetical protein [Lonepinella sp. BR2919]|uniref:hypothetical protein n=1 Tax=unclassified Lonepinella TaxID=2642006 RepID=UPI003F6E1A58
MKLKIATIALATLLLTGCQTFRVGDFTVISTKNVNLTSGKLVAGSERVKGEDSSSGVAYLKNAVDRAIQQDKCAVALSDAVLNVKQGFFTVSYIAEGNLVYDRSIPGCTNK